MFSDLIIRLRALFRRDTVESELDAELRFHVDRQIEKLVRGGMPLAEATRRARMIIGTPDKIKEECRDARGTRFLEDTWQDVRYAVRVLRKSPGFTAVALLSLALGIGVNAALFSLVEAVLFPPFVAAEPSKLVNIYPSSIAHGGYQSTSYPDYSYFRDHSHTLSEIAAYSRLSPSWTHDDQTELLRIEVVSENYFSVLGVKVILGNTFRSNGALSSGRDPSAVISYRFWQQRFGSDSKIIGKTLILNGSSFTIVGVAPPMFEGVDISWGAQPELWAPLSMQTAVTSTHTDLLNKPNAAWLLVIGRLKPDMRLRQAESEIKVLAQQLDQIRGGKYSDRTAIVIPTSGARFWPEEHNSVVQVLWLLAVATGFVLMIACANVANLLLARTAGRKREIGIRIALGASRARIIRQFLIESTLLSLIGSAMGLLLAIWIVRVVAAFRSPLGIQLVLDLRLDVRVLAVTFLLSFASALIFGLVPAITAARLSPKESMTTGDQDALGFRGFRVRNIMVVAEVALAFSCLIGAGLSFRSLRKVEASDLGFDANRVLAVTMTLNTRVYGTKEGIHFYSQLLESVSRLSSVRSVGIASLPPLGVVHGDEHVLVDDETDETEQDGRDERVIEGDSVSPGYFQTLGISILRGRNFRVEDDALAPPVAIINRTMADRIWPQQDPIGKRIKIHGEAAYREVIGVVENTKLHTPWETPQPYFYRPFTQSYSVGYTLMVRGENDPMDYLSGIRHQVSLLDKNVPTFDVEPLSEQIEKSLSQPRLIATSLLALTGIALLLAASGIYGVMSYAVSQQVREFGIRMAVGAQPKNILKLVVVRAMVLVGAGMGLGTLTVIMMVHFLSGFLYGIRPTDPASLIAASSVLVITALLASYVPARRAMRVDPIVALRCE
ncbi:MAG TPA: ABC transporter permease [Candidatus Acidoferrales bacterium]